MGSRSGAGWYRLLRVPVEKGCQFIQVECRIKKAVPRPRALIGEVEIVQLARILTGKLRQIARRPLVHTHEIRVERCQPAGCLARATALEPRQLWSLVRHPQVALTLVLVVTNEP